MRISPTQITTYRACKRRFAFIYCKDLREPSSPSKDLGTEVHAIIERHLRDGAPIDATTRAGAIAQSGARYLPEVGSGKCEQEFLIELPKFSFFGKIDYLSHDGSRLRDWKTTSDYRYAMNEEKARVHPQTVLYGKFGLDLSRGDKVDVQYLYLLTKKDRRGARPLDFTVQRDEIEGRFAALAEESEDIYALRLRRDIDPLTLPPSPSHCDDYGGCPHKSRCNDIHPQDVFMTLLSKESLLAKLKGGTAVETPKPAEPVASQPADPMAELAALKAKLAAFEGKTASVVPPPVEEKTAPPPAAESTPMGGYAASSLSNSDLDALSKLGAPATASADLASLASLSQGDPESTTQPDGRIDLVAHEAPKRRGRPPGSKNKPKEDVTEKAAEALTPAEEQWLRDGTGAILVEKITGKEISYADPIEGFTKTEISTKPIRTLYVNCVPVQQEKGEIFFADSLFASVRRQISEKLGVAHYKLIDYGKGPGIFSVAVEEHVKEMAEAFKEPFDLVVDSRTPEGSDTLSVLGANAALIVRGF